MNVAIVNDSKIAAEVLRRILAELPEFDLLWTAYSGEEAIRLCAASRPDIVLMDLIMPGIDGPTLLKKARGFLGTAPVMFISGYAEAEFSDLLEDEPDVTFLPKPIDIKTLAERVKQQLQAA